MANRAEKGREGEAAVQVQQPVVEQVSTADQQTQKQPAPNPYLYDWSSGMSIADAYGQNKHSQSQILADRVRYGRDTGNMPDIFDFAMINQKHDLNKTNQQNIDDEKRRKRNAMWEQVGYALMNLGNFVGAAAWGAPSPEKPADSLELTKRQQALKDKNDALRRAYNKDFFENYWKMRAQENAERTAKANEAYRQWQIENGRKDSDRKDALNESNIAKNQKYADYYDAKTQTEKELLPYKQKTESAREASARASANNSNQSANQHKAATNKINEEKQMYEDFAINSELYPDEVKKFRRDNHDNWSITDIKRFNTIYNRRRKREGKVPGNSGGNSGRTKVNY